MLQVYLEEIVLYKLPFVTAAIFFAGLFFRVYKYLSVKLKIFPVFPKASKSGFKKLSDYFGDVFLFKTLFSSDKSLWVLSWLFHVSLLVILLGHIRMFLGIKVGESFANFLGTSLGAIFFLTLLFLLVRRVAKLRVISTAEDYFALILLLSVAVSGMYLRLNDVSLEGYLLSLISGEKIRVGSLALVVHAFLAQLLVAYLPFGKLFHSIGVFHSNYLVRWKNARVGNSVREMR
ncbi:Nitrate reductase gamma subunit [Ferroglobus placidus DSM 10642]|uniref:Nitrate reductase gamma subunit n=1 Tax=Ferroglobus placidus (strain DSM 10642 / AEDII12DO) TaxID=589924 RepID=D3RXN4_FERPA|nr:respiratory nitrate reductase subunit gamma [Ferroglobus placidus]ADC65247.1 Nitrate reductase gamma subunit [Ferroglobus placidus DSM 10642]